jgi:nitrate/nitrite transport system substrate-binding protein
VQQDLGFTLATSQSIWPDHPEKVLGCTRAFVEQYPNSARALVMAILEASRFIEQSAENRRSTAQLLSAPEYLDAPLSCIEPRFLGDYADGLGNRWQDPHALRFHGNGEVNLPYLSDGMWFMTQFRRWGLCARTRLPRGGPPGSATGHLPRSRHRRRRRRVGQGDAQQPVARWQSLGRQRSGRYARSFKLHALSDAAPLLARR